MVDEAAPEPIQTQHNTGPFMVTEGPRDRVLSWFRIIVALVLGALLVGDVAIYSLWQASRSQVEAHEHRIERLDRMVTDMLTTNDNAAKIESINNKVDGIEGQVQELTTAVKAGAEAKAAQAVAQEVAPPKKGKR